MQPKHKKQLNREALLSDYLRVLIAKRMQNDKTINGYKLLDNGAVKFYYKAKPNASVNKALASHGLATINNLRA